MDNSSWASSSYTSSSSTSSSSVSVSSTSEHLENNYRTKSDSNAYGHMVEEPIAAPTRSEVSVSSSSSSSSISEDETRDRPTDPVGELASSAMYKPSSSSSLSAVKDEDGTSKVDAHQQHVLVDSVFAEPVANSQVVKVRPRLSDAFTSELRRSVHSLEVLKADRVAMNTRPRLSEAFTQELRQSVHNLEAVQAERTRRLAGRRKLPSQFTDELRKSVHDREVKVKKRGFFGRRPKLSGAFLDELKQSVHDKKQKKKGIFNFLGMGNKKLIPAPDPPTPQRSPLKLARSLKRDRTPTSNNESVKDNANVINPVSLTRHIGSQEDMSTRRSVVIQSPKKNPRIIGNAAADDNDKIGLPGLQGNRTISKELANELRRSFHENMVRQDGHRILPSTEEGRLTKQLIMSKDMSEELRISVHGRKEAGTWSPQKPPTKIETNFRPSFGRDEEIQTTYFQKLTANTEIQDQNHAIVAESARKSLGSHTTNDSLHSFASFSHDATFSEHRGQQKSNNRIQNVSTNNVHAPFIKLLDVQMGTPITVFDDNVDESGVNDPEELARLLPQTEGDFEAYRKEWARLIAEKKRLWDKLATSRARNVLLDQCVQDLNVEAMDLRQRLRRSEDTTNKLKEVQQTDKIKLDSSTDLIARARFELTRAVNDTSKLKARLHEMESQLTRKDRRIEDLLETIERQADIIDGLSNKLKDTETTLRLTDDEKRKVEDEVAVLIASRDGEDMKEIFRQLEQEREKFFWQREMDIESKRVEVEKQNDQIIEHERQRHQLEMKRITEDASRERQEEADKQSIRDFVNEQLNALQQSNRELQEKLSTEIVNYSSMMEEKDDAISSLELEIVKLKKKLSGRDRSKKEAALQMAEIQSAKDELKEFKKHNRLLEKQVDKLTKQIKEGRGRSDGWKEIIFPGYRGVTFGSEESHSLAGFLTILVEEHNQQSKKKGNRSTIDLKRILQQETRPKSRKKSDKPEEKKRRTRSRSRYEDKKSRKKSEWKRKKRSKSKYDDESSLSNRRKRKSRDKSRKKEKAITNPKVKKEGSKKRRKASSSKRRTKSKDRGQKTKHRRSKGHNHRSKSRGKYNSRGRSSSRSKRERSDVDDASMLVFKRHHRHSSQRRRSSSPVFSGVHSLSDAETSASNSRRRARSAPPARILLQ